LARREQAAYLFQEDRGGLTLYKCGIEDRGASGRQVVKCGDEKQRHILSKTPHFLRDSIPHHARHVVVEDDKIYRLMAKNLKTDLAISSDMHFVTSHAEQCISQRKNIRLIVDA
jgi:hypothetical protein